MRAFLKIFKIKILIVSAMAIFAAVPAFSMDLKTSTGVSIPLCPTQQSTPSLKINTGAATWYGYLATGAPTSAAVRFNIKGTQYSLTAPVCAAGNYLTNNCCTICPKDSYCPLGATAPISCTTVGTGFVTFNTGAAAAAECYGGIIPVGSNTGAATWYVDNPFTWTGPDGTYIASASSNGSGSTTGYGPGILFATAGFASGIKDGWQTCVTVAKGPQWAQVQLPYPKTVTRFRFYSRANANNNTYEAPNGFTISASNDGVAFDDIYVSAGPPPGWVGGNMQPTDWMTIAAPAPYLYYRLTMQYGLPGSNCNGQAAGIGRWLLVGD